MGFFYAFEHFLATKELDYKNIKTAILLPNKKNGNKHRDKEKQDF